MASRLSKETVQLLKAVLDGLVSEDLSDDEYSSGIDTITEALHPQQPIDFDSLHGRDWLGVAIGVYTKNVAWTFRVGGRTWASIGSYRANGELYFPVEKVNAPCEAMSCATFKVVEGLWKCHEKSESFDDELMATFESFLFENGVPHES